MVTRLIPSSIHPVVVREGGMSADMGITLMFCLVGIMLIGFALYRFRFRQVRLTERVEALRSSWKTEGPPFCERRSGAISGTAEASLTLLDLWDVRC